MQKTKIDGHKFKIINKANITYFLQDKPGLKQLLNSGKFEDFKMLQVWKGTTQNQCV